MNLDHLVQLVILLLGALAIQLISRGGKCERLGFALGLIGQPFWLVSTALAGQWGMFLLSVAYTHAFGKGLLRTWKPQ